MELEERGRGAVDEEEENGGNRWRRRFPTPPPPPTYTAQLPRHLRARARPVRPLPQTASLRRATRARSWFAVDPPFFVLHDDIFVPSSSRGDRSI
ncbi:hypothetical protein NL676_032860 [Syzygium grande]|nr:hypothetical protein NL676_032860 [Syzygium grande]